MVHLVKLRQTIVQVRNCHGIGKNLIDGGNYDSKGGNIREVHTDKLHIESSDCDFMLFAGVLADKIDQILEIVDVLQKLSRALICRIGWSHLRSYVSLQHIRK